MALYPTPTDSIQKDSPLSLQQAILKNADLCVKCGLCSPHCPTYRLHRIEPESPRGRIALMQGLANGALQYDRTIQRYLDHCLLCRRCERACPSGVPYRQLFLDTHQQHAMHGSTGYEFMSRLNTPGMRLRARFAYVYYQLRRLVE